MTTACLLPMARHPHRWPPCGHIHASASFYASRRPPFVQPAFHLSFRRRRRRRRSPNEARVRSFRVSPRRFAFRTKRARSKHRRKRRRIVTRSLFLIVRYQRYNAKRSARFLRSPINDEFFDFAGDTRRGWMENFSPSRWLVSLDRRHRPPPFAGHGEKNGGIEEARRVIFQASLSRSSRPENVFRFLSRSSD